VENGDKTADKIRMSSSSINNLTNGYLQSILGNALQGTGLSLNSTSSNGIGGISSQSQDNGQLSPLAQVLSSLQNLQQSNPTEYQQVTQQIAANLQSAAQAATNEGNSTAANQLNQLSKDFSTASQTGQLPNISDLAQAIGGGGGHHRHHHGGHHASSSSSSTDSTSTSSSTGSTASTSTSSSNPLDQLLAAFQANATQHESLNPLSIITSTLANAGITSTNS
jgi:hypothetical protein